MNILCLVPSVCFNQSTYTVDEDDGPAQPVLVLSNPLSTDITVQVNNSDDTARGISYSRIVVLYIGIMEVSNFLP